MKVWLKVAALAFTVSTASGGFALAQNTPRDAATEKCWMEAHKEYPKSSGNDVDDTALARAAYFHYAACMEKVGLKP